MNENRRWWVTIGVLMIGALLVVSQLYLTVPLLPGVAERYGVALSTASWVGGGFGLAFAVGNLVLGTVADRFDRRHLMAVGAMAGAVACLAAGAAGSFEVLLVVRVVQGFVVAAFPTVALAHVAAAVPPDRRAIGVTAVSSCFLLAGLVGQGYALSVDRALGWQWVFWLMAPLLAATAIAVLRLPETARTTTPRSFATLLGNRPLLAAYAGGVTLLLTFVGMYTAFNAVVAQRYGITEAGTLLLLRLPGLPGILLGALAGPMITRYGPYRVTMTALAAGAVGLAVEALAPTLPLLLLGSAVYVAGLAVAVPALVTIVGLAGGEARGAALAGHGFVVGLGGGLGPVVAAVLAPAGFTTICLLLGAILAAALTIIAVGPRPRIPVAA
ncbi:MFS transporter [Saccharothrix violaceirubra]|uniref:Putative MFS family arabinose efflux permease n=1 Tax=Saccharothrix violaceirubra TaxID=413306 RepID=A0A7W7T6T9_9PSEU|nr:MFS transporter [Saccharothrix violaceirubra]MBB4967633.1 putative MFS family arabinose efflux permease [Saccharothrix violaceirubra]